MKHSIVVVALVHRTIHPDVITMDQNAIQEELLQFTDPTPVRRKQRPWKLYVGAACGIFFFLLFVTSAIFGVYTAARSLKLMDDAAITITKSDVLFDIIYQFGCNKTADPFGVQLLSPSDCVKLKP